VSEEGIGNALVSKDLLDAVLKLHERIADSELDAHRITMQRAQDGVYVFRLYALNDKDYEGGVITLA
jgi:hypothetical protein